MKSKNFETGQFLIELLLAIGISAIILPALLTGFISSREGKSQKIQREQAITLLQETQEAIRSIRESGWSIFAVNGTFHPEISGSSWILSSGEDVVNGFTRQVLIEDAYRTPDITGNLSSSGVVDPSTKKVTTTISWTQPIPNSISSTVYLTRHLDNASYSQTTEAEFNTGTLTGTAVTNIENGEVVLGAGGSGSWCTPTTPIALLDLPKSGVANAITAIEGRVFAGTGENASGVSFANVNISNTTPPTANILGTIDGYKTNAVFGERQNGWTYGYIATDTNSKEIVIFDISNPPYTEIGSFNTPSETADGESIYVVNNTGYMTAGNKFYNFDLITKNGDHTPLDPDGITLAGIGKKIMVMNGYAYIAIDGSPQLQIIDVSTNPNNLTLVTNINVDGLGGKDVFINQMSTRAYLVTSSSNTQSEFFVIDIDPSSANYRQTRGKYDTNGMDPKGVTAVPGNRAIVVGINGEEYQVINLSTETNPTRCGGVQMDAGINGVASVLEADGDAFSYIITRDASNELKIIEGGPGGQYSAVGTFESSTFDPGYKTAFNRFDVNFSTTSATTINFQIAVADPPSGNCNDASFTFVGPDVTSGTFFATGSAIPLNMDGIGYENPGRCFRYRTYMSTTDSMQTPTFYDITVNYSP